MPTETLRLAVVEVTRHRPHAPRYDAYVQTMVARVLGDATRGGWAADRLAAGDLGVEGLLAATARADAVVILGGEDVSPGLYGATGGYASEGPHDAVADEAQIALVRRSLETRTPLLGVCRGHQIVSVALGGTLEQHLDDEAGLHRTPGVPADLSMADHPVVIDPASRLAGVLGTRAVVRSSHHQAIGRPGAGLAVVARSADGTIEAVEHVDAPITGVQWHPEDSGADRSQLPALLARLRLEARSSRPASRAA
jgi:putative glutamine amidotransferase